MLNIPTHQKEFTRHYYDGDLAGSTGKLRDRTLEDSLGVTRKNVDPVS